MRHVQAPMGMKFVEEVTAWARPSSYEYLIRESSIPIRHEGGRVSLTANGGGTNVEWSSSFEIAIPLLGPLIGLGMRAFAASRFSRLLRAAKSELEGG
jgi:hypothetical protein